MVLSLIYFIRLDFVLLTIKQTLFLKLNSMGYMMRKFFYPQYQQILFLIYWIIVIHDHLQFNFLFFIILPDVIEDCSLIILDEGHIVKINFQILYA